MKNRGFGELDLIELGFNRINIEEDDYYYAIDIGKMRFITHNETLSNTFSVGHWNRNKPSSLFFITSACSMNIVTLNYPFLQKL